MGIYDREYYRGETRGSAWFSGATAVCNSLIAINVAVFVLQNLAKIQPEFINTHFAASVEETFRHYKLWQLLTATFFHDGPWHLIMNMWFFWIVARDMEPLYGSRDFLAFYLAAGIFSSLIWLLFAVVSHQEAPMIGASGAVTAVVTLFTLYYPKREMIFIFIPMPMWMLLVIFLVVPLIGILNGGTSNVAVEAHLAGAGFAVLFKQFDLRWSRLVSGRLSRPRLRIFAPVPREPSRSRSSSPSRSAASVGSAPRAPSVSVIPEEQLDARLDEVLAKIAREGRSGLTEEELRVLQEASRRARIKRSDRP
jgi:membrane associated rhomboid family serine protease